MLIPDRTSLLFLLTSVILQKLSLHFYKKSFVTIGRLLFITFAYLPGGSSLQILGSHDCVAGNAVPPSRTVSCRLLSLPLPSLIPSGLDGGNICVRVNPDFDEVVNLLVLDLLLRGLGDVEVLAAR